jgi:subtilase family serine protease
MRRSFVLAVIALSVAIVPAVPASARPLRFHRVARPLCGPARPGRAQCRAFVEWARDDAGSARPYVTTGPSGLSPGKVKGAYGYSSAPNAGAGQTIAIVDAFDARNVEHDLGVFSKQYGLAACTTSNGCFKKVNQTGGTRYPTGDVGWALEITLDVEWAHAIAPGANVLLVEAKSSMVTDLLAAEDYARAHAKYVSNSWGLFEFGGEQAYNAHFQKAGVSIFAAAGDLGAYYPSYPATSPNVVAVGGTHLNLDNKGAVQSETGLSFDGYPSGAGGGGCSNYEPAPASQSSVSSPLCGPYRATPDVSLVADPASGVSVYFSGRYNGHTGWFVLGGTSAATPMIAARAATTGVFVSPDTIYGGSLSFRDITTGDNGQPCTVGYDLCTGVGSWVNATP